MLVMENKSRKMFFGAFAAFLAAVAVIGFSQPAAASNAAEGRYRSFASGSAMMDTVSLMSFSMARIGDQTFLPPQHKGNAKGKSCDGWRSPRGSCLAFR